MPVASYNFHYNALQQSITCDIYHFNFTVYIPYTCSLPAMHSMITKSHQFRSKVVDYTVITLNAAGLLVRGELFNIRY